MPSARQGYARGTYIEFELPRFTFRSQCAIYYVSPLFVLYSRVYDLTRRFKSAGGLAALNPLPPPNRPSAVTDVGLFMNIATQLIGCAASFAALTGPLNSFRSLHAAQPRPP